LLVCNSPINNFTLSLIGIIHVLYLILH
jgi:hypothetical protein